MKSPSAYARVAPRAYAYGSSDSFPLVDIINEQIHSDVRTIRLVGRGKSTALAHAAAVFENFPNVQFLREDPPIESANESDLTVFVSSSKVKADLQLKLANWAQDDAIEYLMAEAPHRCKSVMTRITGSGDLWLGNGSPRVLSIVLKLMIESDEIQSVEDAILAYFDSLGLSERQKQKVVLRCCKYLFDSVRAHQLLMKLVPHTVDGETVKFLSNQTVRYVLASRLILRSLSHHKTPRVMTVNWPASLIDLIATRAGKQVEIESFLDKLVNRNDGRYASNAASLLVRNHLRWRPTSTRNLQLENAQLANVDWNEVVLESSALMNADLSFASLRKSNLSGSTLTSSNFHHASMTGAVLDKVFAWRADFSDANLGASSAQDASFKFTNFENANMECSDFSAANFRSANLRSANLSNSNLSGAVFLESKVESADFSQAQLDAAILDQLDLRTVKLSQASFKKTSLTNCDLENVRLEQVSFDEAALNGAIMTGTRFRDVSLRNCRLHHTKMAKIDWVDCDLRGAYMIDCHFHMGSTRSGKVDSPYPSHGTRTGFYTDDFDDQHYKRPEEIRIANLCGCDLRGAKIFKSDFYLVDLRGAIYDPDQKEHFQRCGAILVD